MQKLIPFSTSNDALKTLDNGGRFYHLFSKADDGLITSAELGKVAGWFSNKQKMVLYLDLSLSQLAAEEQQAIVSKLDADLQAAYQLYKPQHLLPSEALAHGTIAANAIITGVPRLTESRTDFKGFIMIPITTGQVTTFSMIPLFDVYDVYEIRDEASDVDFLIAHAKGQMKLPEQGIKVGGVLKELKGDQKEETATGKFLEAFYQMEA